MPAKVSDAGPGWLRAAARAHVADDNVPGLVALVASGDEVLAEPLGQLTIGGAPVARESRFRIAWNGRDRSGRPADHDA